MHDVLLARSADSWPGFFFIPISLPGAPSCLARRDLCPVIFETEEQINGCFFSTHVAFALEAALDIPVFEAGDPRIEDTPNCAVASLSGETTLTLDVMHVDGLPHLRDMVTQLCDLLAAISLEITPGLLVGPFRLIASRTTPGPAAYADLISIDLGFDIATPRSMAA